MNKNRHHTTAICGARPHRWGEGHMKTARTVVCTGAFAVAMSTLTSPPAFAGGKAAAGCANGNQHLAYYVTQDNVSGAPQGSIVGDLVNMPGNATYEPLNHNGLTSGLFQSEGLDVLAIFKSVDHNGNGMLCYKLPNGWTQGTSKQTDLLSLVDDKTVS